MNDSKTENTAAGCLHVCVSPLQDKGKRKISFATVSKRQGNLEHPQHLLTEPHTEKDPGATVNSKKAKKRRVSAIPECGNLGVLPVEILEVVLEKCDARALGALLCVSKYFKNTQIVERVAKKRVENHPRADGVEPRARETPNAARVLHFADAADVALRTAAGLDLGAFHTAVLGVCGVVPGHQILPSRRRTDARDFARRKGVGDPDFDEEQDDSCRTFGTMGSSSGASGSSSTSSGQTSGQQYVWGAVPPFTKEAATEAREKSASLQPRGRTLYTFGRGFHGQLGQGGYDDATRPSTVSLTGLVTDAGALETVRCGASHCAALDPNGVLLTWGLASSGELGHGGWTPIEVDIPRVVSSMSSVKVTQVAAGSNHTVAVSESGGMWTCGRGRHGQLGHGHFHDAGPLRRLEALRGMRVVTAVAGGSHSLCLTDCGSVWSWGACRHGQLGLGDVTFAASAGWETGVPWPCLVEALQDLDEPIVTMAAGGHHTLFVTAGGQLWGCGRGEHGALGVGVRGSSDEFYYYEEDQLHAVRGPKDHLLPRLIPVHHKPAPGKVGAMTNFSKIKSTAEKVGKTKFANGVHETVSLPVLFAAASLTATARKKKRSRRSMRASCGGPLGSLPVGKEGREQGGKSNSEQQTENTRAELYMERILEGRGGWVKAPCSCGITCRVVHASAGGSHSCVLTACGAVMTCGSNAYGQLGLGDVRRRYAFERVESLRGTRLATVAVGEDHTGAVAADGRLFLWGRGDWGQLGTGDARSHWMPKLVNGVSVAPPVSAEKFLGFKTIDEDSDMDDDPHGEMGGRNQHDVNDPETAAVY